MQTRMTLAEGQCNVLTLIFDLLMAINKLSILFDEPRSPKYKQLYYLKRLG